MSIMHSDSFIEKLVSVADAELLSCAVTLNVQGTIIYGYLVSREKYLANVAKPFLEYAKSGNMQDIVDYIFNEEVSNANSANAVSPSFVHLEDARIISLSFPFMSATADGGVWWR